MQVSIVTVEETQTEAITSFVYNSGLSEPLCIAVAVFLLLTEVSIAALIVMEEKRDSDDGTTKWNPLHKTNFISRTCFCSLLPYFVVGCTRQLTEDDMHGALKAHESKILGDRLENAWNYEVSHKRKPSLWLTVLKIFRVDLILYALLFSVRELVASLSHPLLIRQFLKFYEPNQTEMSKNEACVYGVLIVVASLVVVVCTHHCMLGMMHLGMKIRVAACSIIYRKALRLNKAAFTHTTVGQMVNLLSNDVERFNLATSHLHYVWLAPTQVVVISIFLYYYVGFLGLTGTTFLLLFIPILVYMGQKTSEYRLNTALLTDERVRLMSEIVNGIQVIKMYTWEKPFAKLVAITREQEMEQIKYTSVIKALVLSFNKVLGRTAIYFCLAIYALIGHKINAIFAYTVSSFYNNLQEGVTKFFPRAVTQFAEATVSMDRIQEFLLYSEVEMNETVNSHVTEYKNGVNGTLSVDTKEVGIHMKNISVKWSSSAGNTLENISFDAHTNQLVAVVGPVGSGKTTLLYVILKELSTVEGSLIVEGSVSYCSQEPWLFGGTVRQNILFGEKFIQNKYDQVVRVCALERDFNLFAYGDQTLVSARGVTLSGGQRARINLARAVYKDADIYLLDDPLSAVDTHVGKHIFEECISDYLKNKCVVLVTHQLQHLSQVQMIYLLWGGKVQASGSYRDLQESGGEFSKLLISGEDNDDETEKPKKITEDDEVVAQEGDAPTLGREARNVGVISIHVYKNYFKAGGTWFRVVLLFISYLFTQVLSSGADYYVNIWVNLEQWRLTNNLSVDSKIDDPRLKGSMQYYINPYMSDNAALIIYTVLIVAGLIVALERTISSFTYCVRASTNMHNQMFNKIVYASMRFFSIHPPGRILNRFSKDIGNVDEALPVTFIDTVEIALTVSFISLVIGTLNPLILVPTAIIVMLFYFMRMLYLATSRDIKRVEAVTRSPVFTHLSASLQGLATIRACKTQEILKWEFDNYQNLNSAPFYLFMVANRTFGFWLDFVCVVYIALVIVGILFIRTEKFGGNVGLALTQVITITGRFQWGMRQWSELENNMTSSERIQEYIEVVPEKDVKIIEPPKLWPEEGHIIFDDVSLRFAPELPYVLKNLTFEIKPMEKVGIVGRTGAGKSSLISAIFRLTDIEGKILIDNINTKLLALADLRSKISIIPQEPVLFSGTIRRNLDPFHEYNDVVIWDALRDVKLIDIVSNPTGLETEVLEGGSNFSVGQRQLVCLARTIIRNNKILVLDEATANVDPYTDEIVQTTIRQKFHDCTVLTVAHRLHTVIDSDRILVIDAGRVVEFDQPYNLLQDPDGVFYQMALQTGQAMFDKFVTIAKAKYTPSEM